VIQDALAFYNPRVFLNQASWLRRKVKNVKLLPFPG
jgi:hypothetical protein